jgi:hypothetical protein
MDRCRTGRIAQIFVSFWTSSWETTKQHLIEETTSAWTTISLPTEEASPFSFLGEASFSFFTNHSAVTKDLRAFVNFDVFNFNYDPNSESAKTPVVDFQTNDKSSATCEDCYLYLGGGFGVEYETNALYIPTYAKGTVHI